MKRRPIKIPLSISARIIENSNDISRINKTMFYLGFLAANNLSYFKPRFHFDSTDEFLHMEEGGELREGKSKIAFRELTIHEIMEGGVNHVDLRFKVASPTALNQIDLLYRHIDPRPGYVTTDRANDPLFSAKVGDRIQVYDSLYRGNSSLVVRSRFHVRNDDHYERLVKSKQQ